MKKVIDVKQTGSIVTVILLLVSVFCLIAYFGREARLDKVDKYPESLITHTNETGMYKIEPKTILSHLEEGKTDVFMPIKTLPDDGSISYESTVFWSQSDYLKIVAALHGFVWNETLENWQLYSMGFEKDCRSSSGTASGEFIYFRVEPDNWSYYEARALVISPLDGTATWGGSMYYPRTLLGWTDIKLDKLMVSVDDVFHLAENNGGMSARLAVGNLCRIRLILNPNSVFYPKDSWVISYMPYSIQANFEMTVDPYTGKYEVLETNP